MKALQVVPNINRDVGGPAVSVSRLAATLSGLGAESTLITLDYPKLGPQPDLAGEAINQVFPARFAGMEPAIRSRAGCAREDRRGRHSRPWTVDVP